MKFRNFQMRVSMYIAFAKLMLKLRYVRIKRWFGIKDLRDRPLITGTHDGKDYREVSYWNDDEEA